MKLFIASLILFSTSAFAQENDTCMGGAYWTLMDKSQRICNYQGQLFEQANNLSCYMKYHNSPTVCWNYCSDASGLLKAKLRVDMTADCDWGTVKFIKTKTTWYR